MPASIERDGVPALRPKSEHFAQRFAACGNATAAYREAFDCEGMLPATVRQRAYELSHEPAVAARVRELLATAAEGTIVDVRSRMVALQTLVNADPSELVRVICEPCRHCNGHGHRYQWRDEDEYAEACAAALDAAARGDPLKMPSDAGGYGYTHAAQPHPGCPECRGDGVPRVSVTPTDQLSGAARKLIRSVRQKANGEIEIRLVDQLQAADMLNRMQSVYVDKSMTITARVDVPSFADIASDPQKALDFLDSIKPTTKAPVTIDGESTPA